MSGADLIVGRFEVLGPQARGNMGEVYRARDLETGETVAVKVIRRRRSGEEVSLTEADKNAARFEREVRIMRRLASPNLPLTIAGGLDGDRPYLAMEFIDGVTLSSLLDENGQLPVSWAAAIGAQIARGLDVAHKAGVVHRDLKPSNVMLATDGLVKVLDFGVGLILDDIDGGPRLTSSDVTVGTARYMAPEQATQHAAVTGAADLYALGCVLYEMLAGAPPFDGGSTYEVLNRHVEQEPLPVRDLRGDVPEDLDAVINRLLEKDPADRPGTAAEVVDLLAPTALVPGPGVPGAAGDPSLALAEILTAGDLGRREPGDTGTGAPTGAPAPAADPVPAADGGFDIFAVHQRLIGDYRGFTEGSAVIRDDRIAKFMDEDLDRKSQWPDPWLSLNPFFADGGSVTDLAGEGYLHEDCAKIFQTGKAEGATSCDGRPIRFYRHQRDAIRAARGGDSYVLTTGTGSGKSLSYIVPIVDRVLRARAAGDRRKKVRAIIVYPMNALANSQLKELERYLKYGFPADRQPVTFERYTGQEKQPDRDRIRNNPPDILLTNYVMLELMLTRPGDRQTLIHMAEGLEFLVFDELHTYRGRQGADVAMLIRRVKDACAADNVQCVGTSATMSTEGSGAERRRVVAGVASEIFGTPVAEENVIGETLIRATDEDARPGDGAARQRACRSVRLRGPGPGPARVVGRDHVRARPRRRGQPRPAQADDRAGRRRELASLAGLTGEVGESQCEKAIQKTLQAGSRARDPQTDRPLFAFRLHQFLSKGDTVYVTLEDENTRHITRDYQVEQPGSGGKILLPLAFCRECGQEYLAVWRQEKAGATVYKARRDASMAGGDGDDGPKRVSDGYLYVAGDLPWPRDLATVIADRRVPESWLEVSDRTGEDVVKPTARKYLPEPVTVDVYGREGPDADGIEAAFIPAPFRFCLRCGVSYEQVRGNDFAKLATLDAEGRSSATSLTSMSIVRSLRAVPERYLAEDARKLLTFVDNRQDAALQAGHFNDFVQVSMIRGALYRAAAKAVDRRRRRPVLRRSAHPGHPGARPGPGGVREGARRRPRAAAAHRQGAPRGGQPARVPRPGARLAGHHAEPGADRTARNRVPGPGRDRRRRRPVAGRVPRAARRGPRRAGQGLPGTARRDAQVAGHRRRVLRRRRVRPDPTAQRRRAAPGVGRERRRRAPGGDRVPAAKPPGHGARAGVHVGTGQVRTLPQARRPVPRLPARDHQRRRAADHRGPDGSPRREERRPARQDGTPEAEGSLRLPGPRDRDSVATRRRLARRRRPAVANVQRRGETARQRLLRPALPGRRRDPVRPGRARAHRAGGAGGQGRARRGLPQGRAEAAVLLSHDGARRGHRGTERGVDAKRAAHPRELRAALRPRRAVRPAGAGHHLLRHRQQP